MLAGADPHDIEILGHRMGTAWLGFIRTGTPATETPWPQYTADHRSATSIPCRQRPPRGAVPV